jgi:predicted glutamine amidotransferase
MCELFAMSSLLPTRVDISLHKLARHGGAEGPHRDGWGIAYYQGDDALVLREAAPASESALVRHVEANGPTSDLVLSHIRWATIGGRKLANTQPYTRELGGRLHVFAHNGDLPGIESLVSAEARYRPIGDTDSEAAFCLLMNRMAVLWTGTSEAPPLVERLTLLSDFAGRLREFGPGNFLYADADTLFAFSDRRLRPDDRQVLPGLFVLSRNCHEPVPDLAASGVALETAPQSLTLVASEPLTGEPWQPLAPGELLAIRDGAIQRRLCVGVSGGAETVP